MGDTKPWYRSRGVMGPLFAAILAVLDGFGVSFGLDAEQVTNAALKAGELAGLLVGIWGRVKANTRIGG